MGEWSTISQFETDVSTQAIWDRAYADADAWPQWNPEIASARLDEPLALGAVARIRFRTGARIKFRVIEFDAGRLFTDEARLPLARMGHRHLLEPLPDGGTRLTNTIYLHGLLAGLWARVLGRRAAAALPDGQRQIAELARGQSALGQH